ncbi:MAG TPA: hypothetical protein VN201_06795, partial [Roseateles sp.]|nr:hypothetical protein [Roseateles sp.]
APGDSTGDFAFRLLDLAAATPMTVGSTVSPTLTAGNATLAYSFDVKAGDRLYFDQLAASNTDMRWRLISPTGEQLWNSGFSADVATRTYLQGGTYTLLLEGRRYSPNPNALSFQVKKMGNTLDERVSGLDDSFDSLPGSAGSGWTVNGPNLAISAGSIDGASVMRLRTSQTTNQTGNAIVTTATAAGQGLSYEVRFNTLVQGVAGVSTDEFIGIYVQNPADPNKNVWTNLFSDANGNRQWRSGSNNIGGAGFTNPAFAFADNTWYHLRIEAPVQGNLRAVLLDDNGNTLASRDLGVTTDAFPDGFRFSIYQYDTLGGAVHPSEVAVDWARVTTTPPPTQAIQLGQLYGADRTSTTQRDTYSFTITQPTQVVMDPRANDSNLQWTLSSVQGQFGSLTFQQRSWSSTANPVMTLGPGTYTLTVTGSGSGHYDFRLLDLASATAITPGATVTGALNPGNETDLYKFDASAGQRFYFDMLQVGNVDSTWRLIAPNGQQSWITGLGSDVDTQVLTQTGTWTLMLEGRHNQAAGNNAYQFKVQPVSDIAGSLTLGATVSDTLTQAGQQAHYQFTLDQRTRLLFDTLNNADFSWTLTGPQGVVVNARGMRASDATDFYGNPLLDLPAGTYTLTIDAEGAATGTFAFRLLDLASATAITPGLPFSTTLTTGTETQLYRFNAQAGGKFFFDSRKFTSNNGDWRLFGPNGNLIARVDNFADLDVQTLPETGTYTVAFEGRYNASASNTLEMLVQDLPDVEPTRITGLEYQPSPDLSAQGLQVSGASGAIVSGGVVTVAWTDHNGGERPTNKSWRDRVVISRVDTGEVLATVILPYDAGTDGPLASGADV